MHFSSIDCAIIIIISVLYDQWGEAQASKQPISIQPNQIGSSYSYFATTTAFMSAISSTIPSGASSAPICFEKGKKARARKELTTRFTMVDHYVPNNISYACTQFTTQCSICTYLNFPMDWCSLNLRLVSLCNVNL